MKKKLLTAFLALTVATSAPMCAQAKSDTITVKEIDVTDHTDLHIKAPKLVSLKHSAGNTFSIKMSYPSDTIDVWWECCDRSGKLIAEGKLDKNKSATVKDLKAGTYYFIAQRSIASDSKDVTLYSAKSPKIWFCTDPIVKAKVSASSAQLSWKKVPGAKSYEIYVSSKANSGYKKVASTKKCSYKLSKVKGKKLSFKTAKYVKVVAVSKQGGSAVKSDSKTPITCKVK